ncbi:hypothetical protein GCM10007884_23890 [Methylobacterium brachythecii]|uniref:Uncharacterized protein n=1 Tax=Methylobacterium brachythecii TaxID=1176177 RepID=A0ABQ6D2U4_9HYPH|nr:hypothetical protein GCM10007884_23890 [Methylobacterium brachythecii]
MKEGAEARRPRLSLREKCPRWATDARDPREWERPDRSLTTPAVGPQTTWATGRFIPTDGKDDERAITGRAP